MSRKPPVTDWCALGFDTWRLWNDAAAVIWLRSARLAAGGAAAEREAVQMVAEKVRAHAELAASLATGAAGQSPHAVTKHALGHYGRKVRANRRRLASKRHT